MSQDIIADALNQIMNANNAKKQFVLVNRSSKLLLSVLKIAEDRGYIKSYKLDGKKLKIELGDFMKCGVIKPRFNVEFNEIDKYMKRYLPGKSIGIIIISTNVGLITHEKAYENKIGGTLIAYFY